jgi:hypothetical protein
MRNALEVSDPDRYWSELYGSLLTRYEKIQPDKSVPLMAVRLLANRYGLGSMLKVLKTNGVVFTAFCARIELVRRGDFVIRMLEAFPPEDPKEGADAVLEMVAEMAIFDSREGTRNLHQFLDRLLRCSTLRTEYH